MSDTTIHADWVDGVRGRTLRWMTSEEISVDLANLTARVEAMCKKRGLDLVVPSDRLYSRVMDLVAARIERPQGVLLRPATRSGPRPSGWGEEEAQIWSEWLEAALPHMTWEQEVFDGLDDVEMEWGVDAGRWREELVSLLPYWIVRSRDLLMDIDPRPIGVAMEEETITQYGESTGEVWK